MKKRIFMVLVVCLAFVLTTWADKPPKDELWKLRLMGKNRNSIVVMTRNIYVGGNVDRLIEPGGDLFQELFDTIEELQCTNFPERAVGLAKEIKQGCPHLVGLQEVSFIDIHLPDYGFEFTLNYEDILMSTLDAMRLNYYIAGKVKNVEAVVPLDADNYVSLTDYDVVLARNDVSTSRVEPWHYGASFNTGPPLNVEVKRGYIAVDAKVGRKSYRFVNTHLEPFIPEVKMAQAMELMGHLAGETLPIILIGDLNAPAPDDDVYKFIVNDNEYVDSWTRNLVRRNKNGYTAGYEPTLDDPNDTLEKRIDFILVKSHVWFVSHQVIGPVIAFVVGDEPKDMTPSGLWPSDHAGVIALLHIPYIPKFH